jgi:hypothetical protein
MDLRLDGYGVVTDIYSLQFTGVLRNKPYPDKHQRQICQRTVISRHYYM